MSELAARADPEVDSDEEEEKQVAAEEETKAAEVVEDTTLANSDVITKYQEAARIVQAVLTEVAALCVAGTALITICQAGDASIEQKTSAIFRGKNKNGKAIDKGIAFPVCVSVNECICHYSPLVSEDRLPPLVDGDMVKIDLGVHIDGYIAVGAHTVVVGHTPNPAEPITGPRADVITAAWTAAEIAAKMIRPGNTNAMVTEAVKKVSDAFGVKAISGTVMHEMKRYVIDGKKVILLRQEGDEKVDACTFEVHEVYSIDVAMSSGEGKPRQGDLRTTVFKREVDRKHGLKIKASRLFFNEVNKRFPTMPFSTRYMTDETAAKMGVRECVSHQILTAYPVLHERSGDQIAHVKFTILLLPNGNVKITGLEMPAGFATPDKALPEDLQGLLSAEDEKAKKKAKKKTAAKKKKAAATAGGGGAEDVEA